MKGRIQKANLSAELGPKSPGLGSTQLGDRSPVLHVPAPWMSSSLFLAPVLFKHKRAAKAATGLPHIPTPKWVPQPLASTAVVY